MKVINIIFQKTPYPTGGRFELTSNALRLPTSLHVRITPPTNVFFVTDHKITPIIILQPRVPVSTGPHSIYTWPHSGHWSICPFGETDQWHPPSLHHRLITNLQGVLKSLHVLFFMEKIWFSSVWKVISFSTIYIYIFSLNSSFKRCVCVFRYLMFVRCFCLCFK